MATSGRGRGWSCGWGAWSLEHVEPRLLAVWRPAPDGARGLAQLAPAPAPRQRWPQPPRRQKHHSFLADGGHDPSIVRGSNTESIPPLRNYTQLPSRKPPTHRGAASLIPSMPGIPRRVRHQRYFDSLQALAIIPSQALSITHSTRFPSGSRT